MDKLKVKKRLKGSGVLVVILSSIAFFIYAGSTYSEQEHFSIMQNKYEKDIKKEYEAGYDDIESFYEELIIKNNKNSML